MSNLCENLKYLYGNFKQYAQHGTVPAVEKNNSQVPQNCFYKSVHYIDSVVGPVKDMLVGVKKDADTSTTTLGKREKKFAVRNIMGFILALQTYSSCFIQGLHIYRICQ